MRTPEIIVVGGGVSGLTCAYELARTRRPIQVWTAEPPERTTSGVAAAFWYPYRADPMERVGPWSAVSYERFASIAADPSASSAAGVQMYEALELFESRVPDPPWSRYVDMFRHAWPEELPEGYGHGLVFEAPVIEMPVYLPWLVDQLRRFGIEIISRRLDSLEPAQAMAEVVVNATGLGARELVGDPKVYPVRGQTVLKGTGGTGRVLIDEHGPHGMTYVIPRSRDVVLGGVADEHDSSLEVIPEQTESIIARCVRLEPALDESPQLGVNVGLRPCRDEVRLEHEVREGKLIVHNYGHGGSGVTLSWGCAEEVGAHVQRWFEGETS